jgi:hypothetical protein
MYVLNLLKGCHFKDAVKAPASSKTSLQITWGTFQKTEKSGTHCEDMKMTAIWDMAPCGLIEVDKCFRGKYCSIIRETAPRT